MLPEAIVENDLDGEELSSRSDHHHSISSDDLAALLSLFAAEISSAVTQLTTDANQAGPIATDLQTKVTAFAAAQGN